MDWYVGFLVLDIREYRIFVLRLMKYQVRRIPLHFSMSSIKICLEETSKLVAFPGLHWGKRRWMPTHCSCLHKNSHQCTSRHYLLTCMQWLDLHIIITSTYITMYYSFLFWIWSIYENCVRILEGSYQESGRILHCHLQKHSWWETIQLRLLSSIRAHTLLVEKDFMENKNNLVRVIFLCVAIIIIINNVERNVRTWIAITSTSHDASPFHMPHKSAHIHSHPTTNAQIQEMHENTQTRAQQLF